MRAFVPEGQIAAVKLGQRAQVKLDSGPRQSISMNAHVTHIDSVASFTPENVYFQDDRVRQVFGVKLRLENSDGSAKPGMPCDAEIFTKETQK
jgi:HlyD family secretion protein